ncbi:MAG: diguanylate cyclase [Planctomycetota bacterium]
MKVLIVDDSADAIAIAKARLAKEGLDIVCADGGRAGLEAAERERPDLILLDLDMPDMSGFDVCRALKASAELCMIPVIFLSGSGTDHDKVVGLDLGAVDYVTKPFDVVELRARVRAALRTKRLQDLLIHYGQVDPLTELNNRRVLMERLREEWARIQRHGGSLAFIMADIDHFKRINDAHGHPQGDRVLCEVARIIAAECRQSDIPGRYGGEEFAVVCVESDAEDAASLAERCRERIEEERVPLAAEDIQVTASFGVSDSGGAASQDELVEAADTALYEAKRAGRNRVVIADSPPNAPTTEKAAQEAER